MSGLRSLRGLVAAWKPGGPASASDAAGAVAAAWPDVVGAAVAARTRPARLRDGLLPVWNKTASFHGRERAHAAAARRRFGANVAGRACGVAWFAHG